MICIVCCCLHPVLLCSLLRVSSGTSLAVGLFLRPQGRVVMLPSVLRAGHAGPQAGKNSRVQGERGRGWMPLGGPPLAEMGAGAPDTAVGLGAMGGIKTANRARQTSTCHNPTTGLHRCSAAGLSRSGWAAC